jgi:hypothetical protein
VDRTHLAKELPSLCEPAVFITVNQNQFTGMRTEMDLLRMVRFCISGAELCSNAAVKVFVHHEAMRASPSNNASDPISDKNAGECLVV